MSCPICGANCKCKKRGPDGMCCSCHRHKVKRIKAAPPIEGIDTEDFFKSYDQHIEWVQKQPNAQLILEMRPK